MKSTVNCDRIYIPFFQFFRTSVHNTRGSFWGSAPLDKWNLWVSKYTVVHCSTKDAWDLWNNFPCIITLHKITFNTIILALRAIKYLNFLEGSRLFR